MCRLCGEKVENVDHSLRGCKKLAQKKYKRRRDDVAKAVQRKLCEKYGLELSEKWYEHTIHLRVQWRMKESRSCWMSVSNVTMSNQA